MDSLTLKTHDAQAGEFTVSWQWRQGCARQPIAGSVIVALDPVHLEDKAAIVELFAIYYLLEVRKIHGENRCGNGIRIELSVSEIRKALLKGSLKSRGVGITSKAHIAQAAEFLATKYFEAAIMVGKWKEAEPKGFETAHVSLGAKFPRLRLYCPLLGQSAAISRHSMHRYVARIDQARNRHDEDDLSKVADARWTAAWRWLEKALRNPNLTVASVTPEAKKRLQSKYGDGAHYLRLQDTQTIFVFRTDAQGLTLATVLRDDAYAGFIEKDAYVVGQKLVRGHIHERAKADRTR